MSTEKYIQPYINLGNQIREFLDLNKDFPETPEAKTEVQNKLVHAFVQSKIHNGWFTPLSLYKSLNGIAYMLQKDNLVKWLGDSKFPVKEKKRVGVIMAGNIPAVGFHDFLSVLISGHIFKGKLSSDDKFLIPLFAEILVAHEPALRDRIYFTERLEEIDAVIATGSNNTSRYFDYYFGKYPHIIRKNRNSVAVIRGDETDEQLTALGHDIFDYFGLGCRNVSKLFIKKGFETDRLFNALFVHKDVVNYKKYGNNYDYNKVVYLMNNTVLLDNGFMLLKEDIGLSSPVGVVFFEYFEDEPMLQERLRIDAGSIQCVVGTQNNEIPFGKAQEPELWDYADNIDTLSFLSRI